MEGNNGQKRFGTIQEKEEAWKGEKEEKVDLVTHKLLLNQVSNFSKAMTFAPFFFLSITLTDV